MKTPGGDRILLLISGNFDMLIKTTTFDMLIESKIEKVPRDIETTTFVVNRCLKMTIPPDRLIVNLGRRQKCYSLSYL